MKPRIFDTHELLSEAAAKVILSTVKQKPDAVLCLASGDTPVRTYQIAVEQARGQKLDFSKVHFIGLDEWVGIGPDNTGSCQFFLRKNIFGPLAISPRQIHLFDSYSKDWTAGCREMDKRISDLGEIDLMLVGIGMNGHVGFNEPGVSPALRSHVVDLDDVTQKVGQKYFKQETVLKQGVTLGLKNLEEARTALLIASGVKKADIMKRTMEEEVSEKIPASFIRKHRDGHVLLDRGAASLLSGLG